ncbi:MAG: isopentenyl phosphate kinase family protein [Candidatus Aenigmarchaeota archaeon]|nr:isopentenyl phosphate kinase family protein [Candidatus Aenigmarchaeota archaeon]
MEDLILIKLGGSLITDKSKPYTPKPEIIERLAREIYEAKKESGAKVIVGHGGGSFPHQSAHRYQTQHGVKNEESYRGIAEVQNDAARLNRIFVQALLDVGEKPFNIMPSASCIAEGKKITEWYTKPIEKALEYDMITVPYGDVGLDLAQGCCIISTEEILRFLGIKLGAKKIIFCGNVSGVFRADPIVNPDAKLIPEITKKNFDEIKKCLSGSDNIDVTGGMIHKVEQALELAENGIKTQIISGLKEDNLKRAILGEEGLGTTIK